MPTSAKSVSPHTWLGWLQGEDPGGRAGIVPCPTSSWCPLQGPAYNRHTLPGDSEPTEQEKEILILRHKSLLVEMSDTCSSRKEVRGSTGKQDPAFPTAWLLLMGFPLENKSRYFKLKLKKDLNPKSHPSE